MTEMYAKVRTDLEIRPESEQPGAAFIVKDPLTRRFYRFTAVQTSVLKRLDGKAPTAAIAAEAGSEHGIAVLEEQVREFIGKLQHLWLLDHPECWAKLDGLRKRRLLGKLLSVKLVAFNPDASITRLEKRLRWCFTPHFVALCLAAMAAALCVSISNSSELSASVRSLLTLDSLLLILPVAFLLITVHEFAHGLTLKHFGGKVEEMGLLLLYFIPGFYCNVSDAWMMRRRERIWVTAAGCYSQLTIWALATLSWRLLAPETLGGRLCAIAIALTGLQTLFNFNPLIKLDGYYILSDLLEAPNLRQKAHAYVRNRMAKILWGKSVAKPTRREARTYACYGVASMLFSGALLFAVSGRIASWLVREFQMWGIVCVFVLLAIPVAGKGEGSSMLESLKSGTKLKRTAAYLLVLAVAFVILLQPWELKVSGEFTILPASKISVSPEVEGTVTCIWAQEGAQVKAGDVLAELENLKLSNEFEETRGELATYRASLALLLAGSRPEEIERARRQVDTKRAESNSALRIQEERRIGQETIARKRAELDNAQKTYERSRLLLKEGLIARNELDRDQTLHEVRQKELSEAQASLKALEERTDRLWQVKRKELAQAESELKILLAGSRKEAIAAVAAQVSKLEEKSKILSRQLEKLKVKSPLDGVVTTPYLHNRKGQHLGVGEALCEIVSVGAMIVEMPVPEKEISDVKLGYPIAIKVRGFPQLSYQARVSEMSPVATANGMERTVVVHGQLIWTTSTALRRQNTTIDAPPARKPAQCTNVSQVPSLKAIQLFAGHGRLRHQCPSVQRQRQLLPQRRMCTDCCCPPGTLQRRESYSRSADRCRVYRKPPYIV